MKKLLVLPMLLFFTAPSFAQLKVLNSGDTFIPHGKSFRIGSESGVGKRFRIVHHGGNDAVVEYYNNLWFNTGLSSSGSDRLHTMVLSSNGQVSMREDVVIGKILTVNGRIGVGTYPSSTFKLHVNGPARIDGVTYSSDKRLKENIRIMKGDLEKLKKLKPVDYNYKDETTETTGTDTALVATDTLAINGRRKKRKRMGFLAQDFREIFPDLVYEDEKGYLSIDYISLIPSLVEALQEQQEQIDQLQKQLKKGNKNARTADLTNLKNNDAVATATETVLYQNRPNPFSESTEIEIELSENAKSAYLYIYDMQGTQKKKYAVQGKGQSSVVIQGNELSAGMYMYALVVDKGVVDTKKMILTD